MLADTKRTVSAVGALPYALQKQVASDLYWEITQTLHAFEGALVSAERQELLREQLRWATRERHSAIQRGASDHADPAWATAALFESWLHAQSGRLPRRTADQMNDTVTQMLRSLLSPSHMQALTNLSRSS